MTIFDWPRIVLDARGIAFNQRGSVITGPTSLTGQNQVAQSDAGYWVAAFDVAFIGAGTSLKVWRALRGLLEGGAHQVRVPVCDEAQAPWPGPVQRPTLTRWSGGSTFASWSGGADWSQPTIAVKVATAADIRATSLAVTALAAGDITGGEYFSLGEHLYVVRAILAVAGGAYTLGIWPPLREAAAINDTLNFDAPVCKMRLMGESEMDLALGRLWQAAPSVNFVEVF